MMQVTGTLIIRKMVRLEYLTCRQLTLALLALFASLALIAGTATSALLARQAPVAGGCSPSMACGAEPV